MASKAHFWLLAFVLAASSPSAEEILHDDGPPIREWLKTLSEQDHCELGRFFHHLIDSGQFGYVLLDKKAVYYEAYADPLVRGLDSHLGSLLSCANLLEELHDSLTRKCQDIWSKCLSAFPIDKYLFVETPGLPEWGARELFFINIPLFKQTVRCHLPLFQEICGYDVTAEALLGEVSRGRSLRWEVLKGNERLFGIVLGFGAHNAQLYHRRCEVENGYPWLFPPPLLGAQPSSGFESLEEELEWLESRFQSGPQAPNRPITARLHHLLPAAGVCWAADLAHPETEALCAEYGSLTSELNALYHDPAFLELVLEKLTAP